MNVIALGIYTLLNIFSIFVSLKFGFFLIRKTGAILSQSITAAAIHISLVTLGIFGWGIYSFSVAEEL